MWVILLTLSERIFKFASMSIMLAPIHLFALLLLHHCSRQTPSKVASAPTELPRAARVSSRIAKYSEILVAANDRARATLCAISDCGSGEVLRVSAARPPQKPPAVLSGRAHLFAHKWKGRK